MGPKRRKVKQGESWQERKHQRHDFGPLKSLIISRQMLRRYSAAVDLFRRVCVCFLPQLDCSDMNEVDAALRLFLELSWEEGEPLSLAGDAICGVQHSLNRRRVFPGAWRYYGAWARHELPSRTPPLHPLVLLGVAGSFLAAGRLDGAVTVLLAFHCLLRTGEALSACQNHMTWSRPGSRGVLALPLTKSGQRSGTPECVTVVDPLVAALLFLHLQMLPAGAAIWTGTAQEFRDEFRRHLGAVHVNGNFFLPYCLRRGGATNHFVEFHHLQSTQLRGRWNSFRACQLYVVSGQRELAEADLSPATKVACVAYAQKLREFLVPRVRALFGARAAKAFLASLPPP